MRNETPTGNTVDFRELARPDAPTIASAVIGAGFTLLLLILGVENATYVTGSAGLIGIVVWALVQVRKVDRNQRPSEPKLTVKLVIWALSGTLMVGIVAGIGKLVNTFLVLIEEWPLPIEIAVIVLFLALLGFIAWHIRGTAKYKQSKIEEQQSDIDRLGSSVRRYQDAITEILDGDRDGRYSRVNNGIRTAYLGGEYYYLSVAGWKRGSAPAQGEETQERPAAIIERPQAPVRRTDQTMVGFDEQQPYGTGGYRSEEFDPSLTAAVPVAPRREPEPVQQGYHTDDNGVTVHNDGQHWWNPDSPLDNKWESMATYPVRTQQIPFPPRDEEAPGVGGLRPPRRGRHGQPDITGTRLDLGTPGAEDGPPANTELS